MSNTIRLTSAAVALVAAAALVLAVIALVTAGENEKSRTIELVSISDPRAEASADLGAKGDSVADDRLPPRGPAAGAPDRWRDR